VIRRCPICGERDCPAWRECVEDHDDDGVEELEEEDALEYERRQRG